MGATATSALLNYLFRPVTNVLLVTFIVIWIVVNQCLIPFESIAFHYRKVGREKEYWRYFSAIFTHYGFLHLVFNCSSLFTYGALETPWAVLFGGPPSAFGSILQFFSTLVALSVFAFGFQMLLLFLLVDYRHTNRYRERFADVHSVGFSGVLFGVMTLMSLWSPFTMVRFMGVIPVPNIVMPVVSLIGTQLLIKRSSFIGHLAGILASIPVLLLSLAGLLPPILMGFITVWLIVLIIYSLKTTRPDLRLLRFIRLPGAGAQTTQESAEVARIEDGVLSRGTRVDGFVIQVNETRLQRQMEAVVISSREASAARTRSREDPQPQPPGLPEGSAAAAAAIAAQVEGSSSVTVAGGGVGASAAVAGAGEEEDGTSPT